MGTCPNCGARLKVDLEYQRYCEKCEYYWHKSLYAFTYRPGNKVIRGSINE
jgi:predicted amidophosphoribosyltransferase